MASTSLDASGYSILGYSPSRPVQHFLGSVPGEGQQQDMFRRYVLRDEMSYPGSQRSCLSGTNSGDYQEGTITVCDNINLLVVQTVKPGLLMFCRWNILPVLQLYSQRPK